MATESQRQVNPIIELAGTQWFVPDWDILEMARLPTNMPQTITLCRLTPQEQRLAADGNADMDIWDEFFRLLQDRLNLPPRPKHIDVEGAFGDGPKNSDNES